MKNVNKVAEILSGKGNGFNVVMHIIGKPGVFEFFARLRRGACLLKGNDLAVNSSQTKVLLFEFVFNRSRSA